MRSSGISSSFADRGLLRAIFVTAPIRTLQLATSIVVAIPRVFTGKPALSPKADRPKGSVSRAKARVDVLVKHPEVAQAITGFTASSSAPPTTPEATEGAEAPASRGGQAA